MDEINQGMDEDYEYEFFKLLLSGKQYTQYFIFSPTQNARIDGILYELKNKKYKNILLTMHVILSGDYVQQINKDNILNLKDISKKRTMENDIFNNTNNKRIKVNT